ncbi:MAG: DoxX family protein [Propionicimonas sp.]|uniref:DoxX family protein n=1 Tax=Propionicimonas sp. TaxID=1955623 RepID=UPI002B1FD06D|nr:DoxX family protein [Propionicimonas sp.]MEA4944604.1 DoxX family protein [Propionicimonas sp.]MEA5055595.1 DoxX family protein [Propionicimonas sp.]MEA5117519.1 DoxX family protein [Propionicimonas sp.]
MTIAYWIVAGLLALAYLAAGGMKLAQPQHKLAASGMAWAGDFPAWSVKVIGLLEVLGAIGVILPPLTGIAPVLAPVAAIGLALVQVGAAITHLVRGEAKALPANIVLLALAVAAAWIGLLVWV